MYFRVLQVPDALDMSVRVMTRGELAEVRSSSRFAYGRFPAPEGVDPGASVVWEVELLEYEEPVRWEEAASVEEVVEDARRMKQRATGLFRRGDFVQAQV